MVNKISFQFAPHVHLFFKGPNHVSCVCIWRDFSWGLLRYQSFRLCIAEGKKRSKLCVCGGFWGHQLILCCKISGGRKWKLEMVSLVWENADEPYRCVWFADPSCAGRIPLTHPMDRLLCETTCAPAAKQAGAIRNPPPPHTHTLPPLKGLAIELSGKWQYLLTWNTHILPIGVGVGSGTGEGPLDAAVAPGERADREVFCGWRRVGGLSWRGVV